MLTMSTDNAVSVEKVEKLAKYLEEFAQQQ